MMKRPISILLCLCLLLSIFASTSLPWIVEAKAATTSQNNIVARADYLYNTTWVCKKNVTGWRGNYTFYAGGTYHIPYGQPIISGAYIGYGVSVDDFLAAAADANSIFYSGKSEYAGKKSTYYANDCSSFVAWCWGVARQTTATIPSISTYVGAANQSNISNYLELGDALNSNSAGHVVLVTGLTYSGSTLTQIEITEQTPPQMKRSYYTPAGLASVYGGSYGIYRYTGSVPAAPNGSGASVTSFGTKVSEKLKNWVFDADYYADKYEDLKAAFGYDSAALYDHYLSKGITEGRQASPLFNVKYYLNQNTDLKEIYGTDYEAAFTHFVSYGQYEASRVYSKQLTAIRSTIFDADFYCAKYPSAVESFGSDEGRIFANFIKTGINKGRASSPVFDISCYISDNEGLSGLYAEDPYGAMRHFIDYGQNEHRVTSPVFDTAYYNENYADAAELTTLDAMKHFLTSGMGQARQGCSSFDPKFYYFANETVLAGTYTEATCYIHYLLEGKDGGLLSAPDAEMPEEYVDLGTNFIATVRNLKADKNWSVYGTDIVTIYTTSDSNAQRWKFLRQSDGTYKIVNVKYGTLLTAKDAAVAHDTPIVLAADSDSAGQRWYIQKVDGYYEFRPSGSAYTVIGLDGGNVTDSNPTQLSYYKNNKAQKYSILVEQTCAHSYEVTTTPASCQKDGVRVYTCADCGHSYTEAIPAFGHSYVDGICTACGADDPDYVKPVVKPNLTLSYPTLNFKDVVYYNVYYQVSDMTDVVEMGLITFDGALSTGTIDDAAEVITGYIASGSNYMVHTNGINAKNLGDALYFKVYAKLSDGSYVYSDLAGYHAVAYAKDILANSTNEKMKSLVVAMLNYGAAAQVQFEYKTDSLMNAFLSDAQKALVADYSADMVAPVTKVDSSKIGSFSYVSGGYSALYPSVSFEGAFSAKFYFTPAKAMDGNLTMYYWSAADYAAADVLTAENATGVFTMDAISGAYVATVEGIAARQIDETIYVAGIYESNGVSYPTGVIAYSLGTYCLDRVANGTGNMPAFAKATIVYGNYAKAYFA